MILRSIGERRHLPFRAEKCAACGGDLPMELIRFTPPAERACDDCVRAVVRAAPESYPSLVRFHEARARGELGTGVFHFGEERPDWRELHAEHVRASRIAIGLP